MAINVADYGELQDEVGAFGIQCIEDLQKWLLSDNGDDTVALETLGKEGYFSIAPSIITRCEAELFNISMPRFALRVYLDKKRSCFVNVRRISSFSEQARFWGTRSSDISTLDPQITVDIDLGKQIPPTNILRSNSCIGDCVLTAPDRFRDYHILQTNLGKLYGHKEDITGTPYLKHICLSGGGLCAQAVCFIASTLLHKHVQSVHGIADITTLAAENPNQELVLRGLNTKGISNYFLNENVGLNAVWQKLESQQNVKTCNTIMRSYLLSGFPVIVPIDSARKAGVTYGGSPSVIKPSIFETNFGSDDAPNLQQQPAMPDSTQKRTQNHAIVLIGCGKNNTEDQYVFHDTACYPFMVASSKQLRNATYYTNDEMKYIDKRPPWLPVTPKEVKMPLGNWCLPEELCNEKHKYIVPRDGLLKIAQMVQPGPYPERFTPRLPLVKNPGQFRLLNLPIDSIEDSKKVDNLDLPDALAKWIKQCKVSY